MRNHVQLADTYYRLSDEERKYGESASITNQYKFLLQSAMGCGTLSTESKAPPGGARINGK